MKTPRNRFSLTKRRINIGSVKAGWLLLSGVVVVVVMAAAVVAVVLISVRRARDARSEVVITETETSVYIIPRAGEGIRLAKTTRPVAPSRTPPPTLYTTVPENYVVSEVLNRNLDRDSTVEQLVLYKDSRIGDYLQLLVIDYDRRRNSYIRAWEGGSRAQTTTGVEIEFVDLTDDDVDELLIYGRDLNSNFTLDSFAIEFTSEEAIISLRNIGNFTSLSTIGIDPGNPPKIVIEEVLVPVAETEAVERNQEPTAIAEEPAVAIPVRLQAYQWSPRLEQFQRSSVPAVANPEISQQFFQQIIQASVSELLQLVSGNWIASDEINDVFLIIDNIEDTISAQVDQRQINFQWRGEFKAISGGFPTIHLTLLNENISSLVNQSTITLLADDEIRLTIRSEPTLTRTYRRIDESSATLPRFVNNDIRLQGWYEGVGGEEGVDVGVEVYFHDRVYRIRRPHSESRGVFTIYTLDEPILELIELDGNRLTRDYHQYLMSYQQRIEGRQLVRALELRPIRLHFRGYQLLEEPAIQLIQVTSIRR